MGRDDARRRAAPILRRVRESAPDAVLLDARLLERLLAAGKVDPETASLTIAMGMDRPLFYSAEQNRVGDAESFLETPPGGTVE